MAFISNDLCDDNMRVLFQDNIIEACSEHRHIRRFFKNSLMVFTSVTSWRSVLLVEETGGPGENHRPAASH